MAFSYGWRGPNIVKDQLVVYLDPGSPNSYYSSIGGTTWKDISGNSNNAALTNGPTFSVSGSGSFIFDGTNDYAQINNTTAANFTLNCWVSSTSFGSGGAGSPAFQGSGIIWSDVAGAGNDFVLAMTGNVPAWFTGNPDVSINDNVAINTGAWFYLSATKNAVTGIKELYVNGVLKVSGSCNANVLNANSKINIGANTLDGRYFNGRISQVTIYNKALSSTEILQNYNATKTRFGL